MQTLLTMKGIDKTFGAVHALKNIDLEVFSGETLALVGENGAGKSTLMKILTGAYQRDSGEIFFNGEEIRKNTPAIAKKNGISQVYQQAELIPELTVAENICIGERALAPNGLVAWKDIFKETDALMTRYGIPIGSRTIVKSLSSAMKQFVAIAKVLYRNPKLIIFDEPTAVLSDSEVVILFKIIESLKKEAITIIYISHRLEEIFQLCDRVSVMRDGALVTTLVNDNLTKNDLITYMLGKTLDAMFPPKGKPLSEKVILELNDVSTEKIRNVSFTLHEGEILGVAGLVGSGRTETVRAIFGVDKLKKGDIKVNGKTVSIKKPADAVSLGLFWAPEDRKGQAMVLCRPIRENVSLAKLKTISRMGVIKQKLEKRRVGELCTSLNVKMSSIESQVQKLSGGNQQKVVIAKVLTAQPQILIFDEPTQGIDVGAKAEIYTLLQKLRAEGKSIIVISSEIEEIQGVCDRAIVMRNGSLSGEITNKDLLDTELILHTMYKEI